MVSIWFFASPSRICCFFGDLLPFGIGKLIGAGLLALATELYMCGVGSIVFTFAGKDAHYVNGVAYHVGGALLTFWVLRRDCSYVLVAQH